MPGWSHGYRAAPVRCRLTPGLISSLPGTDGLPPFISFSTSYPELNSAVLKHTDNERIVGYSETDPPPSVGLSGMGVCDHECCRIQEDAKIGGPSISMPYFAMSSRM